MKALLQRVSQASVSVDGQLISAIEHGLLVFLAVEKDDTQARSKRMAERVAGYRIFADADGKTNLSVKDIQGEVLVVSQFTLAADTRKGMRPSFSNAAPPQLAKQLYLDFCQTLQAASLTVKQGQFQADMQVALINDGPMTFSLES
ncbi:D-aminoacyl-tRNA deacylase [Gayadomonas joobiniege]|uniref:D-aminoacyl-tRNA deacylase n=1 Tax=Gayadomonas joobiniege TaxID=1234606 RepID=UPI00035F019C|nr:D-aminoacyl-tRNA deacylase [Gayadomonas joobiniege]